MRVRACIITLLLISSLWANSPFYSVQTHFGQYRRGDMDSSSVEEQLDLCAEAGIQMIRDECLWSDVETDSGIYVIPPEIDHYVNSALARGIDIYMILNYNNSIYAASNGSGVTTQANRDAYARYCQTLVEHFSPIGVKHYEIWNEPNHGVLFWTPQPNASDYTALLHTAYDSIKAIDSTVIVIGCATSPAIRNPSPYIEGLDFIRDVYAAGGASYMDAISFHLYQVAYRPENEFISYVNSVKSYVGDKPIYFSEFGYPTHNAWPNISLAKQAQYVTRMFLTCLMDPQIQSVVYYDLKNDGTVIEEPEHNFGLLEFDKTPKLAYTALKELISQTDTLKPRTSSSENDVYLANMNDSLTIVWTFSGAKSHDLPVNANYARIEGMLGDTLAYYMTENDTINLSINESPQYCITRQEAPIVAEFSFNDHDFLLYPDENLQCTYTAKSVDGTPIIINPSSLSWEFIGQTGSIEKDIFTASSPGNGMIIADIQGMKDTINITVLEDPGYYTVESFSDTSNFMLSSSYLNMDVSNLSMQTGNNWEALSLNYEYSGSTAIAYISKNILFNHHADSIYLDIKTDEKEYDFRLYCKDAKGKSYTLYMKPRPTTWINTWGTLGCPVEIDESAIPPVNIYKIYVKLRPGSTSQTIPYTGEILLDNLRIKRGDAVGIINDIDIPINIQLFQNYLNPFNGYSRIRFQLTQASMVRLDILDLRGSVVASPLNSFHSPGDHYLDLDMQSLSSGIYIYRLTTPYSTLNRKFAYIK
jgi:hypothetical protein